MAYGILKCDNITFDNGGSDQNVTVSGLYRAATSGVTVTGTISGAVLVGTTTVSGATVTGTVVQGTTVQGVSGTFTSLTGTTTSGTTANFVSGVFTTQVSGTTITGTTSSFTSGNFATLSGATATFTSGVIALGTATNPSLSFVGDPNTGIYSPGADQLAVATNGVARLTTSTTAVSSSLAIDHPLGAVGTPSITFTGDLNTGFYSPAADTLAAVTAGSNRLHITSGGLVGIGTTSPTEILHTVSSGGSVPLFEHVTSAALKLTKTITGTESRIQFANTADTKAAQMRINWAQDSFGAFETWVPNNAANGQAIIIRSSIDNTIFYGSAASTERARIDSSGRLLVGTSTARTAVISPVLQVEGSGVIANASQAIVLNRDTDGAGPRFIFGRTRGTANGQATVVQSGDSLGDFRWYGSDGTDLNSQAAEIKCEVDGTPGSDDMPGRLVFSTTADGASSPTEALRITNDRVIAYNQPTPTSKSAAATLTITELKTGIIQYTGAVATLTLPTGALMEGGFSGIYTNMAFEWSVINTGAGICTVAAGTDHTVIGSGTVAIGASAQFVSRRTAANTFVSYRLS